MTSFTTGIIPYCPGYNPYQSLFAESLETAGLTVQRIAAGKFFPISRALASGVDVLHMNWPHGFYTGRSPFFTMLKRAMYRYDLGKLKARPFVYTAENLGAHDAKDPAADLRMMQRLIDCCNGIVTMSREGERLLRETYAIPDTTRIAVIPHGNYIGAYTNTISQAEAREKLNVPESARVVLALGLIKRYKGLDELVRAFCSVAGPGEILIVAGTPLDPTVPPELQRLGDELCPKGADVRFFFQKIDEDDLQVFFNAADIVSLSYRDAPMNPGGLLLAMSFGRCVVAPAKGSIPETAYDPAIFLYDDSRAGEFSTALRKAMDCPDLQTRGQQCLDFAREHYDWSKLGLRYRELYESILEAR